MCWAAGAGSCGHSLTDTQPRTAAPFPGTHVTPKLSVTHSEQTPALPRTCSKLWLPDACLLQTALHVQLLVFGAGGGTATRGSGAAQLLGTSAALPRAPSQRGRGRRSREDPRWEPRELPPPPWSLLSASPPEGVLRIKGRPPLFEVARSERRALCQRAMPRARGIPTSSPPRPPPTHTSSSRPASQGQLNKGAWARGSLTTQSPLGRARLGPAAAFGSSPFCASLSLLIKEGFSPARL